MLNYVALIKLVKKWNKATTGRPPLAAMPFLLASPLFVSPRLQLLFSKAAKWRFEGSLHGGAGWPEPSLARRPSFGSFESIPATASAPLPAAVNAVNAQLAATGFGSPRSTESGGECCGSVSAPVRCEACVRLQIRFVALSCSHTLCWGCVGATMLAQSRRASLDAPGGKSVLCCPICDSREDVDQGHLEVNALLADDSYVWTLAPADGERGSRRGASRSRMAGIDFASLAVFGSPRSSEEVGGAARGWGGSQAQATEVGY